uniref:Transferase n=1 Tax=Rhizophora mucronata TaxID=61149 RepID=A0A2P2PPV3_RHIMU
MFLFLGSYGQDFLDFFLAGGTFRMWWNDQRIWYLRGLTCHLIGSVEHVLKVLGISATGFNVTSKVFDDEQRKRYERGKFDFGADSPIFVPMTMAALINLVAIIKGLFQVSRGSNLEGTLIQMLIAGYGTINCWPIYEAMVFRNDKGQLPPRTTIIATSLACALHAAASFVLK